MNKPRFSMISCIMCGMPGELQKRGPSQRPLFVCADHAKLWDMTRQRRIEQIETVKRNIGK